MKVFYICFTFLSLLGCDLETSPAPIKVSINDRVELNEQMINVNDRQHNTLYFGFDLRSTLQEDARQYLPFLRYLESSTGYRFKLRFTTKNSTIMEELGTNHVQFAAMGAMSYLKAKEKFNVTTIVQGINLQGQNKYRSFLVVKTDSSIKNLTDIKGKRMAFGDKSSTQGHLIPRIILSQQGLRLSDLTAYIYTGSHQHCAEVVLSGEYDVCGMQDTLAETMEKQGLLRILYRSPYFPGSGIVANDQVSTEVIKVVKQALLDFQPLGKDKDKLYHWDKTEMPLGFSPAKLDRYTNLKQWAIQLGFLEAIAEAQGE
jgi:phosphonate transport system substrate-binding protein